MVVRRHRIRLVTITAITGDLLFPLWGNCASIARPVRVAVTALDVSYTNPAHQNRQLRHRVDPMGLCLMARINHPHYSNRRHATWGLALHTATSLAQRRRGAGTFAHNEILATCRGLTEGYARTDQVSARPLLAELGRGIAGHSIQPQLRSRCLGSDHASQQRSLATGNG